MVPCFKQSAVWLKLTFHTHLLRALNVVAVDVRLKVAEGQAVRLPLVGLGLSTKKHTAEQRSSGDGDASGRQWQAHQRWREKLNQRRRCRFGSTTGADPQLRTPPKMRYRM
jgi:hypothetical protein